MAKYRVGDELIVINDPSDETEKLQKMIYLNVKDYFAQISLGLKVIDLEFDKPYVTYNL